MLRAIILTDEPDEIVIREIDPKTLSAMIHYLYTGDLIEEALDVQMVAHAAAKYRIPGFMDLLCFRLQMRKEELPGEMIADLLVAAHRYEAEGLRKIALAKIRADRKIISDEGFRKVMMKADPVIMIDIVRDL